MQGMIRFSNESDRLPSKLFGIHVVIQNVVTWDEGCSVDRAPLELQVAEASINPKPG